MNNNDNSYNDIPDEPEEQSLPCKSIGPFQLVKFLGSGAFAKVYLAKHETTNEEVAIKYIKKQELFINEMSSPEALSNEINNHKMLFHNNIARIYCTIETNTTISIVTEYCSNGDLISKVIDQGKFNEPTACMIFAQIINGLEYMHSEYGLAHRDMKPENVLFNHLNEVKLCDFGLTKFYNENNHVQLLTTPCGSPIYAAPEMLMNKPYNGNQIDIWSAGITLYVMVSGKLPFDDEDIQSLIQKITKGIFEMPSELSNSCKDLISRLLTVEPSKRITFSEIKRHSWFNIINNKNVFNIKGLSIKDVLIPVDDDIVIELNEEGFGSIDNIIRSIIMNNHDELTVGYYLRVKKKLRDGGKSVSDLANKDGLFMEYICREDSKWEYYDWEEDEVVGKIAERIQKKMLIEENKRAEFMDVPDFSGGKMEKENENDIIINVDVLDEEINEDIHSVSKLSERNDADKERSTNKEHENDKGKDKINDECKENIPTNNNTNNETVTQTEYKSNTNNNNKQLLVECKTESKKTKNTKPPKETQFLSKKKQLPTSTKLSKSKPLSKKKELTITTTTTPHPPSLKDKPKQTSTTKNIAISSYREKPSTHNAKQIFSKINKTLPNSQSTTNLSHSKTPFTKTISSSSHQKQTKQNKIPNIKNSLLSKTTSKQQQPTGLKGRNSNLTINTNNNSIKTNAPAHQKISSTNRMSTETKQGTAVAQTAYAKQNESTFAKFKKIAINPNKDKARHGNGFNKSIKLKQRASHKENESSMNSNRNNNNENSISDISSSIIRSKHVKKINMLNTSVIKAHNNSSRLDSSNMNLNSNNKHNNSSNSKKHSVKSSNPESLKRKIVPKTARHFQYKNTINTTMTHHETSKTSTSGMSHSFSQKTLCNTFKNSNEHNLSIVQEIPQLIRNKKKIQSNPNVIVTKKDLGSVQKELGGLLGNQNVEYNKEKKCFVCKNNSPGNKISFMLEVEEVVKNKSKSLKLTAVAGEGGESNFGKIVMRIKKKLTT